MATQKLDGSTRRSVMNPSQIAQLITEDVKENNGLSTKQTKDAILVTTQNTEVILRIPSRNPMEFIVDILGLGNPKSANHDEKLLEHIQQHWGKIHPSDEIIYEISISPRGANDFRNIGTAFINNNCIRVKLIAEMAEQPWMVKEITQAIKKLDIVNKPK